MMAKKKRENPLMGDNENSEERFEGDDGNIEVIDVRPLLKSGREPLPFILDAVSRLSGGCALCVRAPFEPVPLYGLMASRGYGVTSKRQLDGEAERYWEVLFQPLTEAQVEEAMPDSAESNESETEEGLVRIDLRGDSLGEAMERMSIALEGLRYDDVLLVQHDHDPATLRSHLDQSVFSHREEAAGSPLLRIWRKC
jgi:uncharacterized protein (DUF2249 family)